MGRKNKRSTQDAHDNRLEKISQMPVLVPDQRHLASERDRGTSSRSVGLSAIWHRERYYDYYDYQCVEEPNYVFNSRLRSLFSLQMAAATQRLEPDDKGNPFDWDISPLCNYCRKSWKTFDDVVFTTMPRSELLPARFGCWCSDSDTENEEAAKSKRPINHTKKNAEKYNWYAKALNHIEGKRFIDPYLYDLHVDYEEACQNPYVPTYDEWLEEQRANKRVELKKQLTRAKRVDNIKPPITPPSARTKSKATEKSATVITSNRFSKLTK